MTRFMFNLDDVREVIKDKPEFKLNKREFGWVVDYAVEFETTFRGKNEWEEIVLRNLRGTCFNDKGNIIRLAYHKFRNLGETKEYELNNFNFNEPHIIQEKLDGSMVCPIPFPDGTWQLGTRAGVTDVAEKAMKLMNSWKDILPQKYDAYVTFIDSCILRGITPIFEYVSREQRIVIDYEQPNLVLTGIRSIRDGRYIGVETHHSIRHWVGNPRIDIVNTIATNETDLKSFAETIRAIKGQEGVVVKFRDGRFIKIKGEDYCLKHRALDGLRFEKDVLALVLTNGLDDVLSLVDEGMKVRLNSYRDSVYARIKMATDEMDEIFHRYKSCGSKKIFAEMVFRSPYKQGLFRMYDGKQYSITDYVLSKCGSSTDVESIRWLIGKSFTEF